MDKEQIIKKYLEFKKVCVDAGLFNIDEIIKLFEVFIKSSRMKR